MSTRLFIQVPVFENDFSAGLHELRCQLGRSVRIKAIFSERNSSPLHELDVLLLPSLAKYDDGFPRSSRSRRPTRSMVELLWILWWVKLYDDIDIW